MSAVRTITRVRHFDGTTIAVDWPKLAHITADILAVLPDRPLRAKGTVTGLLSDPLAGPERESAIVTLALKNLQIVRSYLEGYAGTGTVFVHLPDGKALAAALAELDVTLQARWVTEEVRRSLPIHIAAVARTVSVEATMKATGKRPAVDRRSTLAVAVAKARKADRHATAMEVLNRLCGGDVVKEVRDERVYYWAKNHKLTSVGLDRFETIFSEQAPR